MPESLGRRVARLRAHLGWTQQDLADRVGASRVAISHIESGKSDPSERTVTLLAGIFKLEPHDLVNDTTYPVAKAERLPVVAARYTEAELQIRLFEADAAAGRDMSDWVVNLSAMAELAHDRRERDALHDAASRARTLAADARTDAGISASPPCNRLSRPG